MTIIGLLSFSASLLPRRVAKALERKADAYRAAEPFRPRPAGPDVRAYFGPLAEGARVGDATIVAVHDVYLGAIPVMLRLAGGRTVQVDVVRRSAVPGIASTAATSLHLVNRADGDAPTNEAAGLATMALGRALTEREAAGAMPPALLAHEERAARFPGGRFHV